MSAFNGERISNKNYKSMGGFLLAGSNSVTEILLWALVMLPAGIVVSGAGLCFTDIGIFAGTTVAWIFLVKRLKTYKDVSGDTIYNMWDFLYSRYHSEALRRASAFIWFILVGMITVGLLSFMGDMIYSVTGTDKLIAVLLTVVVLLLVLIFTNNKIRSIVQSIFYILLSLAFIAMIVWIFISHSTTELLDTYGKARLSGGTSIYLNILYSDGERLSPVRIISMVGKGFGCLGLPFLYAGAFKAKNNRELDRGRVLSMVFSGVFIVAVCVWALLIVPCIYPLNANEYTSVYELLNVFLITILGEYEFSGVLTNALALLLIIAVFCLLLTLYSMLTESFKGIFSFDKYTKKNNVINLLDILCVIIASAVILIAALFSDSYRENIITVWEFCSGIAPTCFMPIIWKGASKAGVVGGFISGIFACVLWMYVPIIDGSTLAETTMLDAGTASFVISLAILIIVSMFTHKGTEREDKIFEQIRLEQR